MHREINGFLHDEFVHTAELLRSGDKAIRAAAASNNHNIILAALDFAAYITRDPRHVPTREQIEDWKREAERTSYTGEGAGVLPVTGPEFVALCTIALERPMEGTSDD